MRLQESEDSMSAALKWQLAADKPAPHVSWICEMLLCNTKQHFKKTEPRGE